MRIKSTSELVAPLLEMMKEEMMVCTFRAVFVRCFQKRFDSEVVGFE